MIYTMIVMATMVMITIDKFHSKTSNNTNTNFTIEYSLHFRLDLQKKYKSSDNNIIACTPEPGGCWGHFLQVHDVMQ